MRPSLLLSLVLVASPVMAEEPWAVVEFGSDRVCAWNEQGQLLEQDPSFPCPAIDQFNGEIWISDDEWERFEAQAMAWMYMTLHHRLTKDAGVPECRTRRSCG